MKHTAFFSAIAILAVMTISCKNNQSEVQSEVQSENSGVSSAAHKAVLTSDIESILKDMAQEYTELSNTNPLDIEPSEKEKLIEPEYLFNPADVVNMLTKTQKVNAMAMLISSRMVRNLYGLPVGKTDDAIARLAVDLNHPVNIDAAFMSLPVQEMVSKEYQLCMERGEIDYFWQFQFAVLNSQLYFMSQDPDLFLRDMSEREYQSFVKRFNLCIESAKQIAPTDPDVEKVLETWSKNNVDVQSAINMEEIPTVADFKSYLVSQKEIFSQREAELLK